ncbi:hypothetical protein [Morganella morganii]|uniref:hypothetical protein n=1 Tax=Morganella morganii TaxID=582 RepID=UPI000B3FC7A8|nr:hypothetical protein [Morganella morganii]OVF57812.1 hypothetical protein B5724_03690 [Morganella morganii]
MDISRQQFEECIKLHSDQTELEHKLKKAHNGINYLDPVIDLMWISWQYSRDALKPVGYTSQRELQEMNFGMVGIISRNKNLFNNIPVYIKD